MVDIEDQQDNDYTQLEDEIDKNNGAKEVSDYFGDTPCTVLERK